MTAGAVAFLYFARPVVLPIVLAGVAGMTLKPLVRWLSQCHIPPVFGAGIVLGLLVAGVGFGSVQLGRPAVAWVNEAPEHMEKLRQRAQRIFRHTAWVNQTAAAVSALGESDAEQTKAGTTEFKDSRVPSVFISLIFWTWVWGVPGALLSVPILVSVKVVCDRVPALSSVSELLAN